VNRHGGSPPATIPVEAAVGEESWGVMILFIQDSWALMDLLLCWAPLFICVIKYNKYLILNTPPWTVDAQLSCITLQTPMGEMKGLILLCCEKYL
jgi:hypothetical protein